jgi:CRP-like cAMP-binding protein
MAAIDPAVPALALPGRRTLEHNRYAQPPDDCGSHPSGRGSPAPTRQCRFRRADAPSATAIARSAVWLWRLPAPTLRSAMDAGEAWVAKFLLATVQVLAQRLVVMNQAVADLIVELRQAETNAPAARVAELEKLRNRLNTEWSF